MIQILPIEGIEEIVPGDDLTGALLAGLDRSGLGLRADDILVVTQKIVSKAEGRFVNLADVHPGDRARQLAEVTRKDPRLVELVLSESSAVLRSVPHVLITRHRLGHIMANAGIDQSNIGPGDGERVLLLPIDPDGSAEAIAAEIQKRRGIRPPVVVSDSFGRPWRQGVVNVALGVAGLPALVDHRGGVDRDGRRLEVTQVALGDMIASATGLVSGEGAEGIPAVLLRGYAVAGTPRPATDLVRRLEEDLFQ
jgi:coenzyme F420-0:L-glutamate ligase/coenzyme F420-1:gamma-L-glutamate ligase